MRLTKKLIFVLVSIGGLLVMIAFSKVADDAATSSLVKKLLQAHNVPQSPGALATTSVEAKRLAYHYADPRSVSPKVVEQKVAVYFKETAFRREKRDRQGLPLQIDLFDGNMAYRSEINNGRSLGRANQLEDWQSPGVKFNVLTFGIIPLLRRLQDSTVKAVCLRGEEGQEGLALEFASFTWTLYLSREYLIRKVEVIHNGHFLVIEYDDYGTVDGVQLPFKQSLFADGRPVDELSFIKYDLSPSFAEGYFGRDAI
jgi:hypothetical protein